MKGKTCKAQLREGKDFDVLERLKVLNLRLEHTISRLNGILGVQYIVDGDRMEKFPSNHLDTTRSNIDYELSRAEMWSSYISNSAVDLMCWLDKSDRETEEEDN